MSLRSDFRVVMFATMFGSSLRPVVCMMANVLFTLFVCDCVQCCPTHIVLCFLSCLSSSSVLCTQYCPFWFLFGISNLYLLSLPLLLLLYIWSKESEWSCICVLGVSSFPLLRFSYRNYSDRVICFVFRFISTIFPIRIWNGSDNAIFSHWLVILLEGSVISIIFNPIRLNLIWLHLWLHYWPETFYAWQIERERERERVGGAIGTSYIYIYVYNTNV